MKNLQCSREEENVNKLSEDSCHLEMGNIKGSRSSEWHLKSNDGSYRSKPLECALGVIYKPHIYYVSSYFWYLPVFFPLNAKKLRCF